jgi:hypothetical protein
MAGQSLSGGSFRQTYSSAAVMLAKVDWSNCSIETIGVAVVGNDQAPAAIRTRELKRESNVHDPGGYNDRNLYC